MSEIFRRLVQRGLTVTAEDGYGTVVSLNFEDDMGLSLSKTMDPEIARELGVALMDAAVKAENAAKA